MNRFSNTYSNEYKNCYGCNRLLYYTQLNDELLCESCQGTITREVDSKLHEQKPTDATDEYPI